VHPDQPSWPTGLLPLAGLFPSHYSHPALHTHNQTARFFLFFYFFIFVFYKNIFSFSKFTGIYLRPPRCRATGPQGPARKYFRKSFCTKAPAAPQRGDQIPAARRRGGRGIFLLISKIKIYFYKKQK